MAPARGLGVSGHSEDREVTSPTSGPSPFPCLPHEVTRDCKDVKTPGL